MSMERPRSFYLEHLRDETIRGVGMVGVGPATVDQLGFGVVPRGAERDVQRVEMLRRRMRHLAIGRLLIVAVHIIVPAHAKNG